MTAGPAKGAPTAQLDLAEALEGLEAAGGERFSDDLAVGVMFYGPRGGEAGA